ncbi:flagellar motor switch protein FliN [candidate division KSB1 bacterium]
MPEVKTADFENFSASSDEDTTQRNTTALLGDVYIPVSIELASTQLFIKEILELEKGSIIEFNKLAGETVDLLVNDKKFAEGEVVVIDEHFGIRITNIVSTLDVELQSR